MIFFDVPAPPSPLRAAIRAAHRQTETAAVETALALAQPDAAALDRIAATARELVARVRAGRVGKGGIDAFLHQYELSSMEGVVLMCLAEALLRIPDTDTVDRLIRDKIGPADWQKHMGQSPSVFVNASTWALMLTGRVVSLDREDEPTGLVRRLIQRSGEPVIRQAVTAAMRILGRQFVMGRTIGEALERAAPAEKTGYRHSYDMLGEAARTAADAARYFKSYQDAIGKIGAAVKGRPIADAPSISVKLSALHPRYEVGQQDRVTAELLPAVKALALDAKRLAMGFTIDAEEADRLDLSLDLVEALALDPDLAGWNGLGLAVQAYQKRALTVLDYLADLARRGNRRLMVRLVKGAYWDTEVKRAQERGLDGYPVFTRKASTDVNYLACARRMLAAGEAIYPMFATHNALSLAAILEFAGNRTDLEFQRLHGMGEALYEQVVGAQKLDRPCRVYAPVGSHEDLLAYLVRRLLENGANSSFVNRLVDERAPIDEIVADPIGRVRALPVKPHPRIPLPAGLYGTARVNSRGRDLADIPTLLELKTELDRAETRRIAAAPLIGGVVRPGNAVPVTDPADRRRTVGSVVIAGAEDVAAAIGRAGRAQRAWDEAGAETRAECLERAADLLEARLADFMALIIREGGRTVGNALDEVREAVDFCRYYAGEARAQFGTQPLPGPTGERNSYRLHGRGVFICISPWNFPLAIFLGQIAAALAAGNAVVAKPAEQTPLVGFEAVRLLHEAGVPADVLHLLPGDGSVGAQLVAHPDIAGVAFTGSTEVAQRINRTLAARTGAIVPFIAETGGLNVMIADSSALPEQIVADVLRSAFDSAGQRCSALRVLFVQSDIADRLIAMLSGALAELRLGDPGLISTDIGPVIDDEARLTLERHAERMGREARPVAARDLPTGTEQGSFFAPRIVELDRLEQLPGEVFGPILHVIRWPSGRLDQVIEAVNASGYGLTLGIHSRIDETVRRITDAVRVGNIYVNRNMVGAVVGVQPFGGEGLSGTGPKAGGPRYLARFAAESVVSVDTTAAGGNASLLSLAEGETE